MAKRTNLAFFSDMLALHKACLAVLLKIQGISFCFEHSGFPQIKEEGGGWRW